jgi:hypothetical protein
MYLVSRLKWPKLNYIFNKLRWLIISYLPSKSK